MNGRIEDDVLTLVPMSIPVMQALADGRMRDAEHELGATIASEWALPRDVLELRIEQLRAAPRRDGWLLNAVVLTARKQMIGNVGFHGPPGEHVFEARWPGVVELGYDIVPAFQGRGYATRANRLLIAWAQTRGASRVLLSIALANAASQRVADKLGFALLEEYEHDARGRELLYGLAIASG